MERRRIRALPDGLKAKIAAGEVIERPASVVKELVENSIDAGSTEITVTVVAGGKGLIQVTDNGSGIDPRDADLVFTPHATSKIHTEKDLSCISTMGFRGEALYSISAVSRVTLRTRRKEMLTGVRITVEGGSTPEIREEGCPPGTTVEVRDLFFNTPARRKFLRAEQTELSRIVDVVKRLALAHPHIRFRLFNRKTKILDTGRTGLKERIYHLLGEDVANGLLCAELSRPPCRVEVALSPPEMSYASAKRLFLNVNRRPIRDSLLTHAILDGYSGMLENGRYPFTLVHIHMPEEYVDVNVHPAKIEVRFKEPNTIYTVVKDSVERALKGRAVKSSELTRKKEVDKRASYSPQVVPQAKESTAVYTPSRDTSAEERGLFEEHTRFLGQLWGEYALFERGSEFWLVDQHGAMERVAYEKLRNEYSERGGLKSQYLLVPERIETTPEETATLNTFSQALCGFGFELVPFGPSTTRGGQTFLIKAIPHLLSGVSTERLIKDIAEELAQTARGTKRLEDSLERILMTMACHSVIRGARVLSVEEAVELLKAVERTELSSWCPHGRPVVRIFRKEEVEKLFKRR